MFASALNAAPFWYALLALLTAAVCYLALMPQAPPTLGTGWDKLNHALAFVALAASGYLAMPPQRRKLATVLASALVFGTAIEAAQHFVPGRQAEWLDLAADLVGAACGALLARKLWRTSLRHSGKAAR